MTNTSENTLCILENLDEQSPRLNCHICPQCLGVQFGQTFTKNNRLLILEDFILCKEVYFCKSRWPGMEVMSSSVTSSHVTLPGGDKRLTKTTKQTVAGSGKRRNLNNYQVSLVYLAQDDLQRNLLIVGLLTRQKNCRQLSKNAANEVKFIVKGLVHYAAPLTKKKRNNCLNCDTFASH